MSDLDDLKRWASDRGWTVRRTGGDHYQWRRLNCPLVHTASTPSDWRAIRNIKSQLLKAERQAKESHHV